jgi:hypothetical protein
MGNANFAGRNGTYAETRQAQMLDVLQGMAI